MNAEAELAKAWMETAVAWRMWINEILSDHVDRWEGWATPEQCALWNAALDAEKKAKELSEPFRPGGGGFGYVNPRQG